MAVLEQCLAKTVDHEATSVSSPFLQLEMIMYVDFAGVLRQLGSCLHHTCVTVSCLSALTGAHVHSFVPFKCLQMGTKIH